jgi:hypothetical protein
MRPDGQIRVNVGTNAEVSSGLMSYVVATAPSAHGLVQIPGQLADIGGDRVRADSWLTVSADVVSSDGVSFNQEFGVKLSQLDAALATSIDGAVSLGGKSGKLPADLCTPD